MNNILENLIAEIDKNLTSTEIDFKSDAWEKSIPFEPGWYFIKTNAPIDKLKSLGVSKCRAHTDFSKRVRSSLNLEKLGLSIQQSGKKDYVIYNGEAENLRTRAREHVRGHRLTYCLGIADHKDLSIYKWTFCYTAISSCTNPHSIDKQVRLAAEQGWRVKHGWPILSNK